MAALFNVTIGVIGAAVVTGELVPMHLALDDPEPIDLRVAQLLALVAKAAPFI